MLIPIINFILYRIIGFHRHEWSEWEVVTIEKEMWTGRTCKGEGQVRQCKTCKMRDLRNL